NVSIKSVNSGESIDPALYQRMVNLKVMARTLKQKTAKHELVSKEIKFIRNTLKDLNFTKYQVTARLGQKLLQYDYAEPVDAEEIRIICRELSEALVAKRKENKVAKPEARSFLGFNYQTL